MSTRRRRGTALPGAALATAWTRLAWRTGEMLLASSEVIAVRTAQVAAAGATPSAHDRAECRRMVEEKWEASMECGSAVATAALAQATQGAGQWWIDALRLQLRLASLATSTTPAQARARLARAVASSVPLIHRAALEAVERSEAALAPLHRRTGANVRRLRGRKG